MVDKLGNLSREEKHSLLVRARNVLAERGLVKQIYFSPTTGKVCILGAINVAWGGEPCPYENRTYVKDIEEFFSDLLTHGRLDNSYSIITIFNDCPETDLAKALEFLDMLIAKTAPEPENPISIDTKELIAA